MPKQCGCACGCTKDASYDMGNNIVKCCDCVYRIHVPVLPESTMILDSFRRQRFPVEDRMETFRQKSQ